MPFRRAVCKTNDSKQQYVLDEIYKLFCDKNSKFWVRYVRMSPHIQDSAKNLMYLMLKSDPQHRISRQEIINDKFYNTNIVGDEQLKEKMESLKIQSINKNHRNSDNSSSSQIENSTNSIVKPNGDAKQSDLDVDAETKQEIEEKKWTIDAIPFWIHESDRFYYTTTSLKPMVDTLSQYVKTTLNGSCRFHKQSQTLHCYAKVPFNVEFGITIYKSHKWNYWRSVILESGWKEINHAPLSTIYTVSLKNIQGNGNQYHVTTTKMMQDSEMQKIITGVPQMLQTFKQAHMDDNAIAPQIVEYVENDKVSVWKLYVIRSDLVLF